MPAPSATDRLEIEIHQLREELRVLREEQRELARAVDQLVRTFQALAHQLGITAEPYARRSDPERDLRGFG